MLLDYVNWAGISLHEEKIIFRQICYCKSSNSYKLRNAGYISCTRAWGILLGKLEILGLDKNNFGLHSLRAGGATNAANAGVSDRLLKKNMADGKLIKPKMDMLEKIWNLCCLYLWIYEFK